MNNRSGLGLLLIAWLSLGCQTASAQTLHFKQSHHPLPDPDMRLGPEMMADRLKELHELHELQDRVQDLLKDPDFQKDLTNNFSEEQLRQLREKILKGDGLKQDPLWNKLLDQAVSVHKRKEGEFDILRRLAERLDNQRSSAADRVGIAGRSSASRRLFNLLSRHGFVRLGGVPAYPAVVLGPTARRDEGLDHGAHGRSGRRRVRRGG